MLLDRIITKIFSMSCLLIVLLPFVGYAGDCTEPKAQVAAINLLKSLIPEGDPTVDLILVKWADYLKSVSTYSIDDHMEAFNVLQREYSDAIMQMEKCIDDSKKREDKYDPAWADRMITHFGVVYLKDKEKSVAINLGMMMNGSYEKCCGTAMENLFFKEAILYGAYRYYLKSFLDFEEAQSGEVQKALHSRKEAAEYFLNLIDNHSFLKMLLGNDLPRRQLSEIAAKKADERIYSYFMENPIGCKIDAFKAMDDFKKAIRKNK